MVTFTLHHNQNNEISYIKAIIKDPHMTLHMKQDVHRTVRNVKTLLHCHLQVITNLPCCCGIHFLYSHQSLCPQAYIANGNVWGQTVQHKVLQAAKVHSHSGTH